MNENGFRQKPTEEEMLDFYWRRDNGHIHQGRPDINRKNWREKLQVGEWSV